ncbi:RNA-binding protein [Halorhabdus sp. CBA1104]|uniref:RNA-binding protein n=1 Tax=unclassified Halorhabdus TaxID=2621901 RepID=UPI0012B3D0C4|nr:MULTISPECIES: RNA-binding protein [unclassified Halorhabdus]QGN07091.1 RNA-binding protein [Halorhabdus sp. CBA1104]
MSTVPFHYVDLRTFCYATEDDARIEDALGTFLPEDAPIERAETEGHHGDRILILSTRLERADEIRHVLSQVDSLSETERGQFLDQLEDRIDENCSFFLTLDKQAAYNGTVKRGDGITLRGKVEAYPAEKDRAVANVREAFEGS